MRETKMQVGCSRKVSTMCIMSMLWEFEICSGINLGMVLIWQKVIWEYGESIMRLYLTRPYEKQVAILDATWMVFRRVQEDDKA
jgi:hypothetical protein